MNPFKKYGNYYTPSSEKFCSNPVLALPPSVMTSGNKAVYGQEKKIISKLRE